MVWRKVGYVALAIAFALAIYGHNAFGMTLGTVASVLGVVGLVAALRWPVVGLGVTAGATGILIVVYGMNPNVSIMGMIAIGLIAVGIAMLALGRLKGETIELLGAIIAFVANLWFVWGNVISAWTPEFAFVNIALGLGVACVWWAAWDSRPDVAVEPTAAQA